MLTTFKTGDITVSHDCADMKTSFRFLGACNECLKLRPCGCCGSTSVEHRAREPKGFLYLVLHCNDCHAEFSFGLKQEGGGIFPKTRDQDGNDLPNGGWARYDGGTKPAPKPPVEEDDIPF